MTYQHVEEFLVGTGQKEKVEISLASQESVYRNVQASRKESFVIHRSGWGHLRLEIEAKGDFLEVSKKVVTDQDFIGSVYQVEYVIHRNLLGKGNCRGEIRIKSPYQTLVFSVEASLGARGRHQPGTQGEAAQDCPDQGLSGLPVRNDHSFRVDFKRPL